ncbi:MAG: serine/threonine protein kinase [Myxococcaceae bacterium]|nr:serine/threonine protein kinase [Myxococcaceae bacterium]
MHDAATGLPQIGEVLAGKYRITRLLGQGGMGAVFAAHHEILDQEVAIKLLLANMSGAGDFVARFLNEAKAGARIQGEHVVRVLDVGRLDDGRPFMTMELLEGEDLGQALERRGALSPQVTVDYLLQAMEALAQAHALGIVHRDVKPSNLFISARADGEPILKVLDFGISKAATVAGQLSMTSTQSVLGSPLYMSPEQIRNAKHVDSQSDIWSLGAVGFELISGKPPFQAEAIGELFFAIAEQTPPLLNTIRRDVPPGLAHAIARCLTRDKAQRFATVGDVALALKPFASTAGAVIADRVMAIVARSRSRVSAAGPVSAVASTVAAPSDPYLAAASASQPGASGPLPAGGVTAPHASTAAGTWASTNGGGRTSSRGPLIGAAAVGTIVVLGLFSAVAWKVTHRAPVIAAASAGPSATIAPTPPAADPVVPTSVGSAATTAAAPSASVVASATPPAIASTTPKTGATTGATTHHGTTGGAASIKKPTGAPSGNISTSKEWF